MSEKINLNGTEPLENEEDYVFRFKIKPRENPSDPDTVLVDFFREQLRDLFKIVFFSKDGEKIVPNEFGFLNDQDKKYQL